MEFLFLKFHVTYNATLGFFGFVIVFVILFLMSVVPKAVLIRIVV